MSQPSEEIRAREELRKAFVEGAKWWAYHKNFVQLVEAQAEAERRYGEPEGKESLNEKM